MRKYKLPTLLLLFSVHSACLLLSTATAQLVQQGNKLVGSDAVGSTTVMQGWSVSLSSNGNTAIVGGRYDNGGVGAAWIYGRNAGVWAQEGNKLIGTDGVGNANQGSSVSISGDGNTAIVGGLFDSSSTGAIWVFVRNAGFWQQQGARLVGLGAVGSARQGWASGLSADGNVAVIGGPSDENGLGATWVFHRSAGEWTQSGNKLVGTGTLPGPNSVQQGAAVAVSGDGKTIIVGGFRDNANVGATWIFTENAGVWTQQGNKLVGTGRVGSPWQGASVAVSADGNTAILGGPYDNGGAGAAWVFVRTEGVWTQQGTKLVGSGAVGNANQGVAVALSPDGHFAAIGGDADDGGRGAAWIFSRSGATWSQQGAKLVGTGVSGYAQQGHSVSISSEAGAVIVGGYRDSSDFGAAWIFASSPMVVLGDEDRSTDFQSSENYPNPFNLSTKIAFHLKQRAFVTIRVFNTLGQEVATPVRAKEFTEGQSEVSFDGSGVSSGLYFYRIIAEDQASRNVIFSGVRKMLLLK